MPLAASVRTSAATSDLICAAIAMPSRILGEFVISLPWYRGLPQQSSLQLDKMGTMNARLPSAEDLRWVVCPVCRQPLRLEAEVIVCQGCSRRYPSVDGIPVLLANRAS